MVFEGKSFGWLGEKAGEVVFNTSLTGYEEILTDPSYCGQIVAMCYPHIGNYGINLEDYESYKVWVEGFIVRECSEIYSHYRAKISISDYLIQNKIVAIEGIDTRSLVRRIRNRGSLKGIISTKDFDIQSLRKKLKGIPVIQGADLVSRVNESQDSVFRRYVPKFKKGRLDAVIIDFGTKLNIIRSIEKMGLNVKILSGRTELKDLLSLNPRAVILSNGPGDPEAAACGIGLAKELIEYNNDHYLPVLGICLGHQLLALGSGAKTYKLKFGHHGGNHPVKNLTTGKIDITVQNHNYCVDPKTLSRDFEVTGINLNDNTIEGIKHKKKPIISYQYHPEASPGSHDSEYIFKEFKELIDA